jgi:hypothetical protein
MCVPREKSGTKARRHEVKGYRRGGPKLDARVGRATDI